MIGEENAAVRDALCRAIDERPDVLKLFEADKRRVKKTPEARGARGTTLDFTDDDDDEDEDEDEDDAAAPRPTDSSIRHLGLFGEDDEDDEEEEEDDDEEEVEAGDDEEEDDDEEVTPARKRRRVEPDSEESD